MTLSLRKRMFSDRPSVTLCVSTNIPVLTEMSLSDCRSISFQNKKVYSSEISSNSKSFEGPVFNSRVSRNHRDCHLNELVIDEIRKNVSGIFQNFLVRCCKIEFVQWW